MSNVEELEEEMK